MHPAEQQELSQRLAVRVFVRVAQHGPQTTQDLIDAKIVTNADDAIAAMARLVNEERCDWCEVRQAGSVQKMKAIRVAGWHPSERV